MDIDMYHMLLDGEIIFRNWDIVAKSYIEGYPVTYKQLAKKFQIPEQAIKNHGSKYHWGKKRKEFRQNKIATNERKKDIINNLYELIDEIEIL